MKKPYYPLLHGALVIALCVVPTIPAHAAMRFLWPRDHSVVRETVRVSVDASTIPQGAYVNFYLNGAFIEAEGVPQKVSQGRKAFVWTWDTRKPVNLGRPGDTPKPLPDAIYHISARAIGSIGNVLDSAAMSVQLANRVTSISPSVPLHLYYRYSVGATKKYLVQTSVALTSVGGAPVGGGGTFQSARYIGAESVQDVRGGQVALMRYWPQDATFTQFGSPAYPLKPFETGSVYELVDDHGRVHASNLFSTAGVTFSPAYTVDYRTPLPAGSVKLGDSWVGHVGVSMPGIGDALKSNGTWTLSALEWAAGQECARITSKFSGKVRLASLGSGESLAGGGGAPAGQGAIGQAHATGSDWFAFRTGELVRREMTVVIHTRLDQSTVQKLTQALGLSKSNAAVQQGASAKHGYAAYSGPGAYLKDLSRIGQKLMGAGARPQQAQGTPVTLQVKVTARLISS